MRLGLGVVGVERLGLVLGLHRFVVARSGALICVTHGRVAFLCGVTVRGSVEQVAARVPVQCVGSAPGRISRRLRSEEHTSELQSLMRTSYAVFCLKKKTKT